MNSIRVSNFNRIRIRILFGFGKSCEYEYEYIRFWKIIRIRIRIVFGLKISAEYEYHYSVSTIRILFEYRIIRSLLISAWVEIQIWKCKYFCLLAYCKRTQLPPRVLLFYQDLKCWRQLFGQKALASRCQQVKAINTSDKQVYFKHLK